MTIIPSLNITVDNSPRDHFRPGLRKIVSFQIRVCTASGKATVMSDMWSKGRKEKTNMISITTIMSTLTNIIMMIMTAFLEVSRL